MSRMGVEIVGPFHDREVVIDGWRVPLLSACERDGGQISLVVDHRMGVAVPAAQFDQFARFVADVIGVCWGYGAHPRDEEGIDEKSPEGHAERRARFARVPHPSLAPSRIFEITTVEADT